MLPALGLSIPCPSTLNIRTARSGSFFACIRAPPTFSLISTSARLAFSTTATAYSPVQHRRHDRLDKSSRGYEVYDSTHSHSTICKRAIGRISGLTRLLVLEKHTDADARLNFLESRRTLRGRPNSLNHHKGDLKTEMGIGGLEMNDYNVASLHIPYGPGWDARRIDRLVVSV
uniref:Uncharacterized protein n=1 Tax=Mycena chlorophos TaxID=658473 RepID=A0ABQ0KWE6_MYCCL|nr:predicted protein [Mycena chlorophos]